MSRSDALLAWTRKRRVAACYREAFASDAGRIVLADLMRAGGLLETSVGATPEETAFREGRRSMALDVVNTLRWTDAEILALARQRTSDTLTDTLEEN